MRLSTFRLARILNNYSEFQALKQASPHGFCAYFKHASSLNSRRILANFEAIDSWNNLEPVIIDVDAIPEAAYSCEVETVPAIAVVPRGYKSDNSLYGSSDLRVYHDILDSSSNTVTKAKSYADSLKHGEPTPNQRPNDEFNPSTGTWVPSHEII